MANSITVSSQGMVDIKSSLRKTWTFEFGWLIKLVLWWDLAVLEVDDTERWTNFDVWFGSFDEFIHK